MRPIVMMMAALAIGGAAFTTSLSPELRAIGFAIWIVSNGYLLRDFYLRKEYAWVVVYIVYEALNIIGVMNNYAAI
jgi:membrane protein implicated in regulation of membrane protease activity